MTLDDNQKVQIEDDMAENAINEQLKLPKKARPFNLGIGATLIVGGLLGLLWLNRGQVSQNAIVWALAGKGVESRIEVEKIGPKGIEFKNLKIGKKNQETIIAENGKIDWHYEFGTNGLVIDSIAAKSLFGNFGINKNGFDFRDLTPLLKPSTGAKPIIIKDIDIAQARVLIESEYGPLRAHFDLKGNQANGFRGLARLFLPQQFLLNTSYYDKPVFLGFQTSGFAKDAPSFIGLSAHTNDISMIGGAIAPDLELTSIYGNIDASIIMTPKTAAKNGGLFLNLYPSKLNFARFSPVQGIDFLSGALEIDKLYINPNQDLMSKGIIAINGDLNFANGNFPNQAVENVRAKFELARAEDGTVFSSIKAQSGAFRGAFFAANSNLALKINTKIAHINEITNAPLDGRIGLIGKIGAPELGSNTTNSLAQFGFNDIANSIGLNLQSNFSKSKDRFWLGLNSPVTLRGANKSAITYLPINSQSSKTQSGIEFLKNNNQWQMRSFAKGTISGKSNHSGHFNANIESLAATTEDFALQTRDIIISNFAINETKLSGKINSANFSNKNGYNGNLNGRLTISQSGTIKLSPSEVNISANMKNNTGDLSASGILRNFSGLGAKFNNSNFSLSSDFNIIGANTKERIIGKLNLNSKTDSLGFAQNANIINSIINGPIDFNLPTNLGNSKLAERKFSLGSSGLDISTNLVRTDQFSAQDLMVKSPFSLNGSIEKNGAAAFKADLHNFAASARKFDSKDITGTNFILQGRADLQSANAITKINSASCFDYSIDGLRIATNRISRTIGEICPDNNGRMAQYASGNLSIFAQADADNFKLQIGDLQNGQVLELGQINAKFSPKIGGAIGIDVETNKFLYRFKSGPETFATIFSNGAKINANSNKKGNDFEISLNELVTEGLPVLALGGVNGKFHSDALSGLSGDFSFNDIKVKDTQAPKRFGDITLGGKGNLRNNQIFMNAEAKNTLVGAPLAAFSLQHNINNGIGNIAFEAVELEFVPYRRNGLQPEYIVPALKGIVTDGDGKINGNANFSWAPNQPIQSNGVFSTEKFDFLSPLGPASNISGTVALVDLLKIKSAEKQEIKVGLFHPGVPIQNGVVGISFPGDDSIQLEDASWPFAGGTLRLRPENWPFSVSDKDLTIDVEDIDVAQFLRLTELKNFEIDGRMSGFLPIQVRDNEVSIVGGVLRAKEEGGTFRYTGPNVSNPKPQKTTIAKLKERIYGKQPPQGIELAIEALRDLKYKVLEIRVDGRLTGNIKIFVLLEGKNKDVLDGHPFLFRISIDLPLMQALDSLNGVLDPNKQFNIINPDGTLKNELEFVPPQSTQ